MKKIFTIILIVGIVTPLFFVNAFTPNDPYLSEQWYIKSLELENVWDVAQGQDVVVAVLDSGVDTDHPELINRIKINQKEIDGDGIDNDGNGYIDDIKGWDFVDNDNNPQPYATKACLNNVDCDVDAYDHGTFISGVISSEGDNGIGVSGIAPKAKIMPLRVLDDTGTGNTHTVAVAVRYAVDNGANVINMSFSGLYDELELDNALEYAFNHNVAVVIASGNSENAGEPIDLTLSPRYPICSTTKYGQSISYGVGSHNQLYVLSAFSNRGGCIDILAPGENIFGLTVNNPSLNLNNFYKNRSQGTSYSAPMVSGAIALIKSYRPALTLAQIYNLISNSAKNIDEFNSENIGKYGSGALDIKTAIQNVDNSNFLNSNLQIDSVNLVKTSDSSAVYYINSQGNRFIFLDSATYFSWFDDFSGIKTVTSQEFSQYGFGGVVKMRPGSSLVKINSAPQVYAVSGNGILRWIESEELAQYYYGKDWNTKVKDIPVAFYTLYQQGSKISLPTDYDPTKELLQSSKISDLY